MTTHDLQSLISDGIDGRWSEWSAKHPHLAAAIDRTRLVESTTALLRDDPEFVEAMRLADLDEAKLTAAASILDRANRLIRRSLPL